MSRFELDEKLIIVMLGFTFYLRLTLPLSETFYVYIHFIELVLFSFIILVYFNYKKLSEFKFKFNNLLDILLMVSFIVFLISSVKNFSNNSGFSAIANTLAYPVVIFSFFFIFAKRLYFDDEKFEKFIDIIYYISIALTGFSLLFFIAGFHVIPEYGITTSGLFAHPNTASMFYTIVIPILVYRFLSKKISFWPFVILMGLFLITLLFTYSRAGYLGVSIGLMIATYYKSKWLFALTVIFLLIAVTTIVLDFALAKSDSSFARFLLIFTALKMITASQSSFLWGYGPSHSFNVFQEEKFFLGNEAVLDPHNVFLLLSIQFGVLLTALMTVSLVLLIIKAFHAKYKYKILKDDYKLNLSITIVISLFFQNLLEDMIVYPGAFFMPVFLIFTGLIYYTLKDKSYKTI